MLANDVRTIPDPFQPQLTSNTAEITPSTMENAFTDYPRNIRLPVPVTSQLDALGRTWTPLGFHWDALGFLSNPTGTR